jgi:hypothetical protein
VKETVFATSAAPYSVVTTPYTVAITDAETSIRAANTLRASFILKNIGTASVSLGPTGITYAAAPIRLAPGESISLCGFKGAIFGRCNTGESTTISVWEGTPTVL